MAGLLMAGCDPRILPAEGKPAYAPLKSVDRFHHGKSVVYEVFYRGDKERKAAYLTIDDGDSPREMESALDIAKDYDIRRSEEHTSELQSRHYLVCRLLLDKKNLSITG